MKPKFYMTMAFAVFFFCHLFDSSVTARVRDRWQFQKQRDGIDIYLKDVPGTNYRAFRGVMRIKGARVSSLVAAFYDTPSYTRWMHNCIEAKLLKECNDYERYTYTVIHAPWPATNRDTISYSLVTQDPDDLTVTIAITGKPDYITRYKNRVRIPYMDALWTFKPLQAGEVMVSYQTVNDPGGWLPLSLMNMSMIDMPFFTMAKLRDIIKEDKYASANFSVITEPEDK